MDALNLRGKNPTTLHCFKFPISNYNYPTFFFLCFAVKVIHGLCNKIAWSHCISLRSSNASFQEIPENYIRRAEHRSF